MGEIASCILGITRSARRKRANHGTKADLSFLITYPQTGPSFFCRTNYRGSREIPTCCISSPAQWYRVVRTNFRHFRCECGNDAKVF